MIKTASVLSILDIKYSKLIERWWNDIKNISGVSSTDIKKVSIYWLIRVNSSHTEGNNNSYACKLCSHVSIPEQLC
jgi:hypothetical protein